MSSITKILNLIDTSISQTFMRYDAYQLLGERAGISRNAFRLHKDHILPEEIVNRIKLELDDLIQGKPLHRILGYRYFWKDKFELSDDTLEPRPDTETLIEICLKYAPHKKKPYRILDLGTGSGCILVSLLHEYSNATGIGVDISMDALQTAQRNALNANVAARADWQHSNWLENIKGTFDIIVSNPPYIPSPDIIGLASAVQLYDPPKALDGGEDGLDAYRQLAGQLPSIMKENTLIVLEIGYDQGKSVPNLFSEQDYTIIAVEKDYGGNPRCVVLRR